MDTKDLKPGEIVVLIAGVVGLVASFLPWIDVFNTTRSSWSTDVGLFPIATFVPLSATVVAALLAVRKFTSATMPDQILGFTVDQVQKAFAFFGALLAIGWVIAIEQAGIGFWLSVLAAIAAAVGVVLLDRDAATHTAA